MKDEESVIQTPVFRSGPEYLRRRADRIEEALAFAGGTLAHPQKHVISALPGGKKAYFLKPGKEAQRRTPNIHDMTPFAGDKAVNLSFEDIWEYLVKVAIINRILFKKVLVLFYRVCFFVDHRQNVRGNLRYSPSPRLAEYMAKIEFALRCGFRDKFKKDEAGLLEHLHFIDLLGWNEDVKYHVSGGKADFDNTARRKVGRPNTIVSVISVPLMLDDFISNIIQNVDRVDRIDVRLILSTMQQLARSRGVCALSHAKLQKYLSPYLTEAR